MYTSEQDNDVVWGYIVMSPTLILLRSSEEFAIIATINGPLSQCSENGKLSVKVDDIVVNLK